MPNTLDRVILKIIDQDGPGKIMQTSCDSETGQWCLKFPRLSLLVRADGLQLKCEVVDNERNISRKVLDPLRQQVRHIIDSANGGKLPKNEYALLVVILQALECILEYEIIEEQACAERSSKDEKWRADEVFDFQYYIDNPNGLDTSSVADTAYRFLGKTPAELCEDIPKAFRIIHIESILRHDLANRFNTYVSRMREMMKHESVDFLRMNMAPHSKLATGATLSNLSKDDIIDDMCKPRVTYHGTPLRNVASIVRNGFKMPGTKMIDGKTIASPRTGIAYDRGIYSSQAPFYALSFAQYGQQRTPFGDLPTMRLFICATVMGRTLSPRSSEASLWSIHGPLADGYDSHFEGNFEYIVHDSAAMLPCYVVHLDLGTEAAKRAIKDAQDDAFLFAEHQENSKKPHPKLEKKDVAPGDAKREAEARKAAAMKWFPKGFGSAKGTTFRIDAIGELEDDEEEYGEWQAERRGFFRDDQGHWMDFDDESIGASTFLKNDDEGDNVEMKNAATMLNQYQAARNAVTPKRTKKS